MKKLQNVLLSCLLLMPNIASSATLKEERSIDLKLKDQFYLVIAMGYDSYQMIDHINFKEKSNGQTLTLDPVLNLSGLVGDLILGYGKTFDKFYNTYLGLEVFLSGSAADNSYELSLPTFPIVIDTDVIVNGSYGVNLLPGIKLNPASLLYLKIGYNWSLVSIEETIRDNTGDPSVEMNESNTGHGFSYGIGLESAVDDHFSVRAELNHSSYDSFTTELGTKINASDNQVLLGLVYHFI